MEQFCQRDSGYTTEHGINRKPYGLLNDSNQISVNHVYKVDP